MINPIFYVKHMGVKVYETLIFVDAKRFYEELISSDKYKGEITLYKDSELLFEEVCK